MTFRPIRSCQCARNLLLAELKFLSSNIALKDNTGATAFSSMLTVLAGSDSRYGLERSRRKHALTYCYSCLSTAVTIAGSGGATASSGASTDASAASSTGAAASSYVANFIFLCAILTRRVVEGPVQPQQKALQPPPPPPPANRTVQQADLLRLELSALQGSWVLLEPPFSEHISVTDLGLSILAPHCHSFSRLHVVHQTTFYLIC